jgi:hypothetical protein
MSLVCAAMAIPLMGVLNYGFAWLRRPLDADMMVKNGRTLEMLSQRDEPIAEHSRWRRCCGCALCRCVAEVLRSPLALAHCLAVQLRHERERWRCCCCRRSRVVSIASGMHAAHQIASKAHRAKDSKRARKAAAYRPAVSGVRELSRVAAAVDRQAVEVARRERQRQREEQDRLFEVHSDAMGYLHREQLRKVMGGLNGPPEAVSDFELGFVWDQAEIGDHDHTTLPQKRLRPAVALWRYAHFEQAFIDGKAAGQARQGNELVTLAELQQLLAELNDGTKVTRAEAEQVVLEVEGVNTEETAFFWRAWKGGLSREQLRAAVAVWYHRRVFMRRSLAELGKVRTTLIDYNSNEVQQ